MYTCFAVCFLEAPSGSHLFGIDACFVFASALQFQSLFQAFRPKLRLDNEFFLSLALAFGC
jgi:hypothetical protein